MSPTADAVLWVAAVHLTATAVPGPTSFVVMQASISQSWRSGVAAALGIVLSDVVWAVAALLGLALLVTGVSWLAGTIGLLGGAYLVYLGVRTWLAARDELSTVPAPAPGRATRKAFRAGLIVNLANPKSVVFFGSIFAASLPAEPSAGVGAAVVAVIAANALWWHCLLAVAFSARRAQVVYRRVKPWADRVAGVLFAVFGVLLIRGTIFT